MIIQSIFNLKNDLPTKLLKKTGSIDPEYSYSKNSLFVVYGMSIFGGYIWYFIDDKCSRYPMSYPAPLFKIIDQKISKFWVYNFINSHSSENNINFWSFPEWANYPQDFYGALLEDEEKETKIFQNYKYLMEMEFPNPLINVKAEQLEDRWLLCPLCIDAWQSNSNAGMVICPICKTRMHNPNYQSLITPIIFDDACLFACESSEEGNRLKLIIMNSNRNLPGKVVYIKNDYSLFYDAIDESTLGALLLIYGTLTIAFSDKSREFVSLDAYTNIELWQRVDEIKIPKISKNGSLTILQGFKEDNRISFEFEPIYKYSRSGVLQITLSNAKAMNLFEFLQK